VKAKADPLRMNVHLGAELFAYAEEKARTGGYRSIAEVVRQALREMRDRDRDPIHAAAEARARARGVHEEDFQRAARARIAALRKKKG
jgi:putative addiction module CopG family antidote